MAIQILPPIVAHEAREQVSFAHYSRRALRNMYEACLAKQQRLQLHRAKLDYWIDTEHDLFELLKLAEQFNRTDANLSRLATRIPQLRDELMKRQLREMT